MPLVKSLLGAACKGIAVDKGLAGGEPGAPPLYIAIGHTFGESLEAVQTAFEPHATEILAIYRISLTWRPYFNSMKR
jgi:uncharacterized protein (TIGR02118 family)